MSGETVKRAILVVLCRFVLVLSGPTACTGTAKQDTDPDAVISVEPIAPNASARNASIESQPEDGSSGSPVQKAEPSTYFEYMQAYYDALCAYAARCAGIEEQAVGMFCQPDQVDQMLTNNGYDRLRVTYNPTNGNDCLEAMRTTCGGVSTNAACQNLVVGQVADGEACIATVECANGSYCDDASQCPGTCRRAALLGEGCSIGGCVEGSWCVGDMCVPFGALTETCFEKPCEVGLSCGADLTCQRLRLYTQRPGETCTDHIECHGDNYCDSGTCVARGKSGTSCRSAPCAEGYTCYSGVCEREHQFGDSCLTHDECDSRVCTDGICRHRLQLGETCERGDQCYSSYCPHGTCASSVTCQ